MKKILVALLVTGGCFASLPVTSSGAYQINRASRLNQQQQVGTNLYNAQQLGVKGTWSFAADGGAVGTITLKDHEGNPVKLPNHAIIRDCMIDVVSALTTSASGTLAINSKAAGDLKAATAAASLSAGVIDCVPVGTAATSIKLVDETTLGVTIATGAMTAGKINVWVEYALSE